MRFQFLQLDPFRIRRCQSFRQKRNVATRLQVERLEERAVPAATWHVTLLTDTPAASPVGELRRAVTNAQTDFNQNGGIEVIDFMNNGVPLNGVIQLQQKLDDINFTFQITGNGLGANTVTIKAGNGFRVFNVLKNGTISGLELIGGNVAGNAFNDNTGGVIKSTGNLTVSQDSISGGTAKYGGGIASEANGLTVDRCQISGNSATDIGGGIYARGGADGGTLAIKNQTHISNNSATNEGGGVCSMRTTTLDQTTIEYNYAVAGGGIYAGGDFTITNSTIGHMNQATSQGGAGVGGGIFVLAATINLTNSTVADNYADSGGGIYVSPPGTLNTKSATIAFNTAAGNGGGVYIVQGGTVKPVNTAFVQNGAMAGKDVFGTVTSLGHNLISVSAGSNGFTAVGDIKDPVGGTNFLTLGNSGGPTETCTPDVNAIDKGDNAAAAGLATDQRGAGFPRIVNGTVDIGAVEIQPVNPGGSPVGRAPARLGPQGATASSTQILSQPPSLSDDYSESMLSAPANEDQATQLPYSAPVELPLDWGYTSTMLIEDDQWCALI